MAGHGEVDRFGDPGQSFIKTYEVGLQKRAPFEFEVDAFVIKKPYPPPEKVLAASHELPSMVRFLETLRLPLSPIPSRSTAEKYGSPKTVMTRSLSWLGCVKPEPNAPINAN